jgi:hypothetical protein
MQPMTEEEARIIMKVNGWNYKERSPKRHAKYVYARRGQNYRMIERYICPLSKLPELTEKKLVAILAKPIEDPSNAESEPEASDTTSPPTNTDEI